MTRRRSGGYAESVPAVAGRRSVARRAAIRPGLVLAVVGVALVAGAAYWAGNSPRFYVQDVQIVGAMRVTRQAILEASGLERIHMLWVDEAQAQASVEALAPVKQAEVTCRNPARCTIVVTEHALIATWVSEGGTFHVDEVGGVLASDRPLEGKWLVSGPLPTDAQGRVAEDVLAGLGELTRLLGTQPWSLSYHTGRGLVFTDPGGWRVILGQGEGMEERLQVYAAIRAHLVAQGLLPRFVDVRFPQAPYYSETNDW